MPERRSRILAHRRTEIIPHPFLHSGGRVLSAVIWFRMSDAAGSRERQECFSKNSGTLHRNHAEYEGQPRSTAGKLLVDKRELLVGCVLGGEDDTMQASKVRSRYGMKKQTLGMMIASLRKENKMTQADLAEKLGVTDKAVSKWERDLSCPDVGSIPRLAGYWASRWRI